MGGCTSKDKTVTENEGCVNFLHTLSPSLTHWLMMAMMGGADRANLPAEIVCVWMLTTHDLILPNISDDLWYSALRSHEHSMMQDKPLFRNLINSRQDKHSKLFHIKLFIIKAYLIRFSKNCRTQILNQLHAQYPIWLIKRTSEDVRNGFQCHEWMVDRWETTSDGRD